MGNNPMWKYFDSNGNSYLNFSRRIDRSKFDEYCKKNLEQDNIKLISDSK